MQSRQGQAAYMGGDSAYGMGQSSDQVHSSAGGPPPAAHGLHTQQSFHQQQQQHHMHQSNYASQPPFPQQYPTQQQQQQQQYQPQQPQQYGQQGFQQQPMQPYQPQVQQMQYQQGQQTYQHAGQFNEQVPQNAGYNHAQQWAQPQQSQQPFQEQQPYGGSAGVLQTPAMRAGGVMGGPQGMGAQQPDSQDSRQTRKKAAQRVDPKQIPREEAEKVGTDAVTHYTCSGAIPPRATSTYHIVDEGNCSPRFIRLTTNQIANSEELMEQTKLVVGAVIQPLAELGPQEDPIPYIDAGDEGPLRCPRCRAYVNPFFQFVDNGDKFKCCLCQNVNSVPSSYRCNLDANGKRRDLDIRPELTRGTVDFKAPKDFVHPDGAHACFLFVVDVSRAAMEAGVLDTVVDAISRSLDQLEQMAPHARVGIMTYHQRVHYFALKPPRKEPQMYVVADIDDMFVPAQSEELLVPISDPIARANIETLLAQLPSIHDVKRDPVSSCALGAAVSGAAQTLKKSGGKMIVFQSGLPDVGVGTLQPRDDSSLYSTEREKELFMPQTDFYATLAAQCADTEQGGRPVGVDLFVCSKAYVDLATVSSLCTETGGQVYFYEGFDSKKDGDALFYDVWRNLTRPNGFEGIMRVRTSNNLKVAEMYGNFYRRMPLEMELPVLDSDKAFGITFKHEGKLEEKTACIQCALLYTTSDGDRRIRVHTLSAPVTSALGNIYRFADLDAIVSLSLKQACTQILKQASPKKIRQSLTQACIDSLFVYRKFCASATSPGQLILPEPLKLLPVNTLGMIKNPLFHGGQPADERAYLFAHVASMAAYETAPFVSPQLFCLTNLPKGTCVQDDQGRVYLPPMLTLSSESLSPGDIFLLDTGRFLTIWIGQDTPSELLRELFDVDPSEEKVSVRDLSVSTAHADDPEHLSTKVNTLIDHIRQRKSRHPTLAIVAPKQFQQGQGGQMNQPSLDEQQFVDCLIEDSRTSRDRGKEKDVSSMSYVDFLCHIHKRIQDKFY